MVTPPSPRAPRRRRLGPVRSVVALSALTAALLAGIQAPSSAADAPSAPVDTAPITVSPEEHADLLAEATRIAAETATALGLDPQEGLQPSDAGKDADGTTHFRYERTFSGLPVLGGDLVVHRSPQGALSATRAQAGRIAVPSITPTVSAPRTA
ncbi:peptidase M4 family protein, partial [Streptomyces sp. SID3343]|nr:peptidase M4 family protein [Streptomyces sp. SID3343]